MEEISLIPANVLQLGNYHLTNSVLSLILIMSCVVVCLVIGSKFSVDNPSRGQLALESVYEGLGQVFTDITALPTKTVAYSLVLTLFITLLTANWFGLLPIVGSIGLLAHSPSDSAPTLVSCLKARDCIWDIGSGTLIKTHEFTPLFRAPSSDLAFTVAMALISVLFVNLYGGYKHRLSYFKKYLNFSSPLNFFVGLLELISELGKIISFSFRLFGNIFAGEILLIVISFLTFGLAVLPFYGLEFFVGFIQAFVFFVLTSVFLSLAIQHESH